MAANSKRAAKILDQIIYATIATVGEDGQPWNSPVFTAFDGELNFYWTSDKDAQHSQNIRANGKVFLAIYDSTVPQGTGEGVYIMAEAREITDPPSINAARTITQGRKGRTIAEDEYTYFSGEAVRRVYKAIPQKIWTNDNEHDEAGHFLRDIRVELHIEEVKQELRR
jgi:uncharacterized pyridoxamine 5'-phosphate oxidase family protein